MAHRNDYDYNHATSNTQFLAILLVIAMLGGGGVAVALMLFGLLT